MFFFPTFYTLEIYLCKHFFFLQVTYMQLSRGRVESIVSDTNPSSTMFANPLNRHSLFTLQTDGCVFAGYIQRLLYMRSFPCAEYSPFCPQTGGSEVIRSLICSTLQVLILKTKFDGGSWFCTAAFFTVSMIEYFAVFIA